MRRRSSPAARRSRRCGYLLFELVLLFPVLLVLVLAAVEFGLLLQARQQLLAASREGCRVAAVGGSPQDVEDLTRRVLGSGRLGAAEIQITLEDGTPLPAGQRVPTGEAVAVWVRLPARYAVPDLLRFIGYSLRDDEIVGRTVMRCE
jgi:hypothetical protein